MLILLGQKETSRTLSKVFPSSGCFCQAFGHSDNDTNRPLAFFMECSPSIIRPPPLSVCLLLGGSPHEGIYYDLTSAKRLSPNQCSAERLDACSSLRPRIFT